MSFSPCVFVVFVVLCLCVFCLSPASCLSFSAWLDSGCSQTSAGGASGLSSGQCYQGTTVTPPTNFTITCNTTSNIATVTFFSQSVCPSASQIGTGSGTGDGNTCFPIPLSTGSTIYNKVNCNSAFSFQWPSAFSIATVSVWAVIMMMCAAWECQHVLFSRVPLSYAFILLFYSFSVVSFSLLFVLLACFASCINRGCALKSARDPTEKTTVHHGVGHSVIVSLFGHHVIWMNVLYYCSGIAIDLCVVYALHS